VLTKAAAFTASMKQVHEQHDDDDDQNDTLH